jgi:hypothetical protein
VDVVSPVEVHLSDGFSAEYLVRMRKVIAILGSAILAIACGGSGSDDHGGPSADGGPPTDARVRLDAHGTRDGTATKDSSSKTDARDSATTHDARDVHDGGMKSDAGCTAEAVITCPCSQGMGTERCAANGSGWGTCACVSYGAEYAVSPAGNDSASGTLAHPFLTLERAQTAVRALIAAGPLPAGGVVVWLRGGVYTRTASFALTSEDSGSATSPVVYRGYPGETARLVGGVQIPASAFKTVTSGSSVWARLDPTAQGQVVAADVTSLGITDFGTLSPRATFNDGVPAALELFIDGTRAPLGRWPDADDDDFGSFPGPNVTQLTLYGAGVVPDVTGVYVQTSTQDGASAFTRQGQVDGKTWNLYRATGGTAPNTWVAWFLTTSTSGYPTGTDPFFSVYQSTFGVMDGSQGATGHPTFVNPQQILYGFSSIAAVTGTNGFTLAENRVSRWTQASDPWVHGYFAYTWADSHLPVASVNGTTGEITLTGTPYGGLNATILGGGPSPVYAYNLLEEITEPAEWYLDRTSGLLYLWPPTNLSQHDLVASVLSSPLVTVTGAAHVTFQEITLEATRTELVQIGGSSSDIQVVGCTLRDSGDSAVDVVDGTSNVLSGDLIYAAGEDGVELGGGDRPSLTPGQNAVLNSDIHDYGEWVWTYTPAVNLTGDGNIVQHNELHASPHSAILFYSSSQQLVQYNDVYDVLKFASDSGAIYSWGDWGSPFKVSTM